MDFSGRRLQEWFPYSTLLGLTVDTYMASVYEAFWKDFTCGPSYFSAMLGSTADTSSCVSLRYEVFVVPVVVHDMCRMVQTMQNCLEVPQVQFLRGCGRRFVLAATSSRQSRDGVQIRSSTSSRRTDLGFLPHS